jgi:hypothetical protein
MERSFCADAEDLVAAPHLCATARGTRRGPSPAPGHRGAALALVASLATLVTLVTPAPAVTAAATCLNGFAAISISNREDSHARLADRNRDGIACRLTVQGRDGIQSTVLLDNFIGDPSIYPVASCTTPFRSVVTGTVITNWLPAAVQRAVSAVDANRDGMLCVSISHPELRVLIVLDNPNVVGNPER